MKLAGKTAIITAGAMAFGGTLAKGLAAEGASIVIADRDKPKRQSYKIYIDEFVEL